MCCVMGYTGHDLSAEKFKEYLLRTVNRGPDDQRVVEVSLRPDGLWAACHHGTDPGGDAALLPGR